MENVTIDNNIGDRIKKLLDNHKLKMVKMCDPNEEKHIGMTRQRLSKAINGETSLTIAELKQISDYFDVSLEYLIGTTDYRNDQERAAGEYLGLQPESIATLHDNINDDANMVLDYLLLYQPQNIYNLLRAIYNAIYSFSEYKYALNRLQEDIKELKPKPEYTFNAIEDKQKTVSYQRLKIQDAVKDIIEKTDYLSFLPWEYAKKSRDIESLKITNPPNPNRKITSDELKDLYKRLFETF